MYVLVYEWMYTSMGAWIYGCMDVSMNVYWVDGRIFVRMYRRMDVQVDGCTDIWVNEAFQIITHFTNDLE